MFLAPLSFGGLEKKGAGSTNRGMFFFLLFQKRDGEVLTGFLSNKKKGAFISLPWFQLMQRSLIPASNNVITPRRVWWGGIKVGGETKRSK